jgi:O-antigen ligase
MPGENTRGTDPPASGLPRIAAEPRPSNIFLWPALCLLFLLLFGCAFILGGIEAATISLAVLIGAWAVVKPRSGLWASNAFLVFLFVYFQKSPMAGPDLPSEFYYWGAGVSLITLGLCIAWLREHHGHSSSAGTPHRARFDRAMVLMFLVSLAASLYGLHQGNSSFAVARQFFGCLLLPVYYWFGRSFFRSPEDVDRWLHLVGWAVVAGAAWYVAKLGFISLSEGAYYREQSQLGTFAGAIGSVLFVEFFEDQRFRKRLPIGAAFAVCVLAIVLMGSRVVAGSLAATAIILALLQGEKRRLAVRLVVLALFAVAASLAVTAFVNLLQDPGVLGQIASRFSPLQLDEDSSYVGRLAQWQEVGDVTRQHPILGAGMGSEFSYSFLLDAPETVVTTYVDNGWGFLLLKMGILGLLAFVFLAGAFLWFGLKGSPECSDAPAQFTRRCLLAILLFGLIGFIGGPSFFHFTQSGFFGTALGGLAVLAEAREPRQV